VATIAHAVDAFLDDDPIVVYDTMREAANRLVARYVARGKRTGDTAPEIVAIRAIRAQVRAVGTRNLAGIEALRVEFEHRCEALDA